MEMQMKNVFQNIPVGIYVSYIEEDAVCDCIPTMINDAVCQMTGFSRREILEKFSNRFSNLICPEDRGRYLEAIEELNGFPHSISISYKMLKKSGETVKVTDRIQSLRHEDGKMWTYACLIQEESDQKQKERYVNNLTSRVEVQTFGRFNVLIDGKPIVFHSEKAKELFALLIDRKGYYVSNREIITCLWEDDLVDSVTQSRCRKVVFNLKKTLELYGLEDLVESNVKGYRRLNTDLVNCDLYQYLSGDERYQHLFQGSYLNEYSWAEMTLSNLLFNS